MKLGSWERFEKSSYNFIDQIKFAFSADYEKIGAHSSMHLLHPIMKPLLLGNVEHRRCKSVLMHASIFYVNNYSYHNNPSICLILFYLINRILGVKYLSFFFLSNYIFAFTVLESKNFHKKFEFN